MNYLFNAVSLNKHAYQPLVLNLALAQGGGTCQCADVWPLVQGSREPLSWVVTSLVLMWNIMMTMKFLIIIIIMVNDVEIPISTAKGHEMSLF
jgi:hypothetical protein